MKNDHIIYFIDTKGNPVDEIGKELINKKIYRKKYKEPENFEGTVRYILITGKGNMKIFGIIILKKKLEMIYEKKI